jgi:hypothetical protein
MADLHPTEEQQELTGSIARLLAAEADPWPALAELGWLGIGAPESCGGTDLPMAEQALVARELGRALAPLRTLAAIAGARLAALAGRNALATAIASGTRRVALLVPSPVERLIWSTIPARIWRCTWRRTRPRCSPSGSCGTAPPSPRSTTGLR